MLIIDVVQIMRDNNEVELMFDNQNDLGEDDHILKVMLRLIKLEPNDVRKIKLLSKCFVLSIKPNLITILLSSRVNYSL